MVNKDLGMVTAYAYAVSKGYTGTEEEFAELMADYADVGERAEAAAEAAAASATAASGSAGDSAASATAAEGSAAAAATSAGNASQAAQNASQSATAAAGSATAAGQSATAAAGSATTAGNKATEAAQSATGAAASATAAGTSATAAQTAQTAAETAQTAAETAQAAAEAAAQTLVIDPTLTQPNQAAEAKATGDAISLVKSQLSEVQANLKTNADIEWESGNIDLSGAESVSSVRARTVDYVPMTATINVDTSGAYSYRFYNSSDTFTESTGWITGESIPNEIKQNSNSAKCRLVFKSIPEGAISSMDVVKDSMSIKTIQNPFDDLKDIMPSYSEYFSTNWQDGKYCNYNGDIANVSGYSLAIINVEGLDGQSVTIHSWLNGYAGCPVMARDGTLLMRTSSSAFPQATEVTYNIALPLGCAYIYLTTVTANKSGAYVKFNEALNHSVSVINKRVESVYEYVKGSTTNPLMRINDRPMFIDCFLTVGCIGDSLASGESYYDDDGDGHTGLIDIYQHSWGQYLARMTGNTYYNFSKGGLSTKTWLASQYATDCFDGNHNCTAYIIGLGQNDKNAGYTIGTSADIDLTDYNNNADTFYGSYGKIIQKIKEIQPKAKIFVVTDPLDSVENAGYNTAIRTMETIFDNVYVVDIRLYGRNTYYSGLISKSSRGGHYNAIAYRLMASIIGSYISWIIENNPLEFKAIEFIDTHYSVN